MSRGSESKSTAVPRDRRRARLVALNRRLRACRACHMHGFLDERESTPIALDPAPDAPLPRIVLIGQAPGLRAQFHGRPFAGPGGDRLRTWFSRAGIPRRHFYRDIHFLAVTRCFPGKVPGAKGDRLPSPAERALCRPWQDEAMAILKPPIVLLVGLLAIRAYLGPVRSLDAVVGAGIERDGVRYLPLPHPSGVSRWLNEPANRRAVGRAMRVLRGWLAELPSA